MSETENTQMPAATPLDGTGPSAQCTAQVEVEAEVEAEAEAEAEAERCVGLAESCCQTGTCPAAPTTCPAATCPAASQGGEERGAAIRAQLAANALDVETQCIEKGAPADCDQQEDQQQDQDEVEVEDPQEAEAQGSETKGEEEDKREEEEEEEEEDESAAAFSGLRSTTSAGTCLARTKRIGSMVYSVPPSGQRIAVIQFAGPTQLTRANAHAFRLCGVFATDEEADEHIEDLPPVATCKIPMAKSVTFGRTIALDEGPMQIEFVGKVLESVRRKVEQSDAEFELYIARRKTGKETEQLNREEQEEMKKAREQKRATKNALDHHAAQRVKPDKEAGNREAGNKGAKGGEKPKVVRALKACHAVPDQTHAVVGLLHDPDDHEAIKQQWVVTVWGVFGNVTDAKGFLSDTVQHEHRHHASFVVKMYNWVYPDETNTPEFELAVRGVYRHADQQDMWDAAHDNRGQVEEVMRSQEEYRKKMAAAATKVDLDALTKAIHE
jgi:hypothetical protein